MNIETQIIKTLVGKFPSVVPHLTGRARWIVYGVAKQRESFNNPIYSEARHVIAQPIATIKHDYKTYDFFLSALERMITNVYNNDLGGEFIDVLANLISGQLTQAFEQAWKDEEGEGELPDYLSSALEDAILNQYDFVDGLYRDVVDARVDETPIDPLLARATLWANRWTEAYNQAVQLITSENGGNMVWELGATEQHCDTCAALNGIVARASEWKELGVAPQNAPNDLLTCGGWQCDCSLTPTDKRRSPDAYGSIMNIIQKG